jgi:hypothetical protein
MKAAESYYRAYEMERFQKHNQSIKIARGQTWRAVKVELGEAGAEPKGVLLLELPFQQVSIHVPSLPTVENYSDYQKCLDHIEKVLPIVLLIPKLPIRTHRVRARYGHAELQVDLGSRDRPTIHRECLKVRVRVGVSSAIVIQRTATLRCPDGSRSLD